MKKFRKIKPKIIKFILAIIWFFLFFQFRESYVKERKFDRAFDVNEMKMTDDSTSLKQMPAIQTDHLKKLQAQPREDLIFEGQPEKGTCKNVDFAKFGKCLDTFF